LRGLTPRRPLTQGEALGIAERQATRLLAMSGISEPPVPETVITALPRVRVHWVYPLEVSGTTRWVRGLWLIVIHKGEHPGRVRFSLAHEAKHVIDHPVKDVAYVPVGTMTASQRREKVCDHFAACLLMPRPWVKRLWGQGVQDIAALADCFGVSHEAMRVRLQVLGLGAARARCEVAA
jgi:hypothetical protein